MKKIFLPIFLFLLFSLSVYAQDEFANMMNSGNFQGMSNWCGCSVTVSNGGPPATYTPTPGSYPAQPFNNNGTFQGGTYYSSTTGYTYSASSGSTSNTTSNTPPPPPPCYSCSCDAFFCPGGNPANAYTPPNDSHIDNDYPNYDYSNNGYSGGSYSGSSEFSNSGSNTSSNTGSSGTNPGSNGSTGSSSEFNNSGSTNPEFNNSGGTTTPCPAGGRCGDDPSASGLYTNIKNPVETADEPIIENGIKLEEAPVQQKKGRLIGYTANRNNTEDMLYGKDGDTNGIREDVLKYTDDELFEDMQDLFDWCTFFDSGLREVGKKMVDRFKASTGETFGDPALNKRVSVSANFQNFLKTYGDQLNTKLQSTGGDIDKVDAIKLTDLNRPRFNGTYNKFHGLQILVNDTEYTEINIENFTIDADGNWVATVNVTIYDHFGLDKNDALVYQNNHSGFASWWSLQHTKGYRPFETKIEVRMNIKSKIKK